MLGKTLRLVLLTIIVVLAICGAVKIRPAPEISPSEFKKTSTSEVQAAPQPAPKTYKLILENGVICLYTLDSAGVAVEQRTIDYINIYALYEAQINQLLKGITFDSREAAAEFIQDLGS
ncbi:MAG: hypothetical protein WCX81_00760 [Monoglobales bacterium]